MAGKSRNERRRTLIRCNKDFRIVIDTKETDTLRASERVTQQSISEYHKHL